MCNDRVIIRNIKTGVLFLFRYLINRYHMHIIHYCYFYMDLSNENIVYTKTDKTKYIQFKKLLKYSDIITHAFSVGTDVNFRGTKKEEEKIIKCNQEKMLNDYTKLCTSLDLEKNNIASIDWNALNADAEGPKKNAKQLAQYAIKTSEGKEMVVLLMHDTYGKEETVKALPTIIKYFKDNGYEFRTLV